MYKGFELAEKESVARFHFTADEVLKSSKDKKLRQMELDRTNTLGNLEHQNVKAYFEDDIKKKVVQTTIWAVKEDAVVLKQNLVIPRRRIHKLEI